MCRALVYYQVKETSSLHRLFGLPEGGVRWSLGYQMFGFREPVFGPASPSRGRVRLSGFGHVGLGGSVALCDPASGLAFAMVTNKVDYCLAFFVVRCRVGSCGIPHPGLCGLRPHPELEAELFRVVALKKACAAFIRYAFSLY